MKKLLIAALLLVGCESSQELEQHRINNDVKIMSDYLIYYKDTRTNLCFAGYGLGWNNGALTNVPCNEQVEKVAHHFVSSK